MFSVFCHILRTLSLVVNILNIITIITTIVFIIFIIITIIIIIIIIITIIIILFLVSSVANPRVKNIKLKANLEWLTFGVIRIDEGASKSNLIETLD